LGFRKERAPINVFVKASSAPLGVISTWTLVDIRIVTSITAATAEWWLAYSAGATRPPVANPQTYRECWTSVGGGDALDREAGL